MTRLQEKWTNWHRAGWNGAAQRSAASGLGAATVISHTAGLDYSVAPKHANMRTYILHRGVSAWTRLQRLGLLP